MGLRTPIVWYGGKQRLAPLILRLLPPHKTYVEPFCGGAAVYWQKEKPRPAAVPGYREVLNDLDPGLINFWSCLRDDPERLQALLQITQRNEREFHLSFQQPEDPFEAARRFFIVQRQCYSGTGGGWGRTVLGRNMGVEWVTSVQSLMTCGERMQGSILHHGDALEMFDRYDAPDTLFYCDPPYAGTDSSAYVAEYKESDWARLVTRLEKLKGSFILSHYPAAIEPQGTVRIQKHLKCAVGADVLNGKPMPVKTEVLWCRYNGWKPKGDDRYGLAMFSGSPDMARAVASTLTLDEDPGEDAEG